VRGVRRRAAAGPGTGRVIWLARWPRGSDTCGRMDGRDGQEARTHRLASARPGEGTGKKDWHRTWGACDWPRAAATVTLSHPSGRRARRTRVMCTHAPLPLPRAPTGHWHCHTCISSGCFLDLRLLLNWVTVQAGGKDHEVFGAAFQTWVAGICLSCAATLLYWAGVDVSTTEECQSFVQTFRAKISSGQTSCCLSCYIGVSTEQRLYSRVLPGESNSSPSMKGSDSVHES
jgi:hypothetical protein